MGIHTGYTWGSTWESAIRRPGSFRRSLLKCLDEHRPLSQSQPTWVGYPQGFTEYQRHGKSLETCCIEIMMLVTMKIYIYCSTHTNTRLAAIEKQQNQQAKHDNIETPCVLFWPKDEDSKKSKTQSPLRQRPWSCQAYVAQNVEPGNHKENELLRCYLLHLSIVSWIEACILSWVASLGWFNMKAKGDKFSEAAWCLDGKCLRKNAATALGLTSKYPAQT